MKENKPILFFDGHCNLCNGFVDLIVRQDKSNRILLSSLQGETAKKRLPEEVIKELSTVVFLETDGKIYYKSSAVFRVARVLGGPWTLLRPFWILPRFFTNWVYDRVALNRYRLFGRKDTCRLPTPEERAHFLD